MKYFNVDTLKVYNTSLTTMIDNARAIRRFGTFDECIRG